MQHLLDQDYTVQLKDVFEGPMDLLVHLIKKHEVDIYDIPIALITHQFLEYVEWIKLMDVDYAGDFLLMASTLAQIKSRMLLPTHGNEEEEDEDPRLEITRPLLEYLQIKSAADQLAARNILGDHIFTRKGDKLASMAMREDEVIKIGLFELIDALQNILDRVSGDHEVDLSVERISVQDRIVSITDLLEEKGSATFEELFSGSPTKTDIIVTFLALLEMIKLTLVRVVQHVQTGIIRLFYL
jgi:segregation and condensation protein A